MFCSFIIRGLFAHWRKQFSTASALTYSFPPRTAVIGLLGAILGVDRRELPSRFRMDQTKTAVCPIGEIRKDVMPQIWRHGPPRIEGGKLRTDKLTQRFQQNLEVMRYPEYRVIFSHEDGGLMEELAGRLKDKRWHYAPYLGMLGFLADVEFEAQWPEPEPKKSGKVELHSILPLSDEDVESLGLAISRGSGIYITETDVPVHVDERRVFSHLHTVYVPAKGDPLRIESEKELEYYHFSEKGLNVIFLER